MTPDREPGLPCLLDGAVVPDGRITVSAESGLVTHGEGLFETLPVIDGRPVFLAAHLARLAEACRALDFGPGPGESLVRTEIAALSAVCGLTTFSLRLTAFRDAVRIRRLLVASRMPEDAGHAVVLGFAAPRFDGPRPLAGLKTLNYLVSRRAHADGVARGCDEVLFTMPDGTVLEGTRSSIFLVAEGGLVTPPLSLPILPSVTRAVIVSESRKAGHSVKEEPFKVGGLLGAREAFISASVRGVRPVRAIDGKPLPVVSGELTKAVRALYQRAMLALP